MINEPVRVVCDDFQNAWLVVVRQLIASRCEVRNLIAQIKNPTVLDQAFHENMEIYARAQRILGPKRVATVGAFPTVGFFPIQEPTVNPKTD
jgi:hypothetical protein